MILSECELAEARATISRALDEDLRYGPDVTTSATVPDGAITTASLITRGDDHIPAPQASGARAA